MLALTIDILRELVVTQIQDKRAAFLHSINIEQGSNNKGSINKGGVNKGSVNKGGVNKGSVNKGGINKDIKMEGLDIQGQVQGQKNKEMGSIIGNK